LRIETKQYSKVRANGRVDVVVEIVIDGGQRAYPVTVGRNMGPALATSWLEGIHTADDVADVLRAQKEAAEAAHTVQRRVENDTATYGRWTSWRDVVTGPLSFCHGYVRAVDVGCDAFIYRITDHEGVVVYPAACGCHT